MRWSSCCTHPRRHLAMCHFRLNHSHYSWNREFHNIPDFATYIFVPDPWSEVNPFCELMKGRMHLKTMRLLEEGCHQCPCKISTVNFLLIQNYWQKSMAGTCERTFETPCKTCSRRPTKSPQNLLYKSSNIFSRCAKQFGKLWFTRTKNIKIQYLYYII